MKFYDNWKEILRRSWSLRFIILAGILSGCEAVLPFFSEDIPKDIFAILSLILISAAFVARLVVQKGI